MIFVKALQQGHRIRHRNWPPFHYPQLKSGRSGELKLWRFAPHGNSTWLEIPLEELRDDLGWSLIDVGRDPL